MGKKEAIILLAIFLMIFSAAFATAYPVKFILSSDEGTFHTDLYKCANPACTSYSNLYATLFGNPNEYTITGSGTQYFGEFNYKDCYLGKAFNVTTYDTTGYGPWSYDINFVKAPVCHASMYSFEASDYVVNIGDTVHFTAVMSSPYNISKSAPYPPSTLIVPYYSFHVNSTFYVAGVLKDSKTLDVAFNKEGTVNYQYTFTEPGSYRIETYTMVDDCKCNSSILRYKYLYVNVTGECGDSYLDPATEECEPPNSFNNQDCSQTTSTCDGTKQGTRDTFGNCDSGCGCTDDPFNYQCVKGQCGATCAVNADCDDHNPITTDVCLSNCSCTYTTNPVCGDGLLNQPSEECEPPETANNQYCSQLNVSGCVGPKLGTRDSLGDCDDECGCQPDSFTYECSEQCGAGCTSDEDCPGSTCNKESCTCTSLPFCGDSLLNPGEECEPKNSLDNEYCDQTSTSECIGPKLGTRDAFGNCGALCSCQPDPFTYECSEQCDAACVENEDCPDGKICLQDSCTCQTCIPTGPEICDNIDNDCDGDVDEGLIEECSTECGSGIKICYLGEWSACTAPWPMPEICDDLDNDCDGEIDEDPTNPVCDSNSDCGMEICAFEVLVTPVCVNPGTCDSHCSYTLTQKFEICDDGQDNDCDGLIDEGCYNCTRDSQWGPGHQFQCMDDNTYLECENNTYVHYNICKAYCSASAVCDGRAPSTYLNSCAEYGEVFLQDYCDAKCHLSDNNCESDYLGCTADKECDELAPLTEGCNGQCKVTESCGDGLVQPPESCELPGTSNNTNCQQSTQECNGALLGTRDSLGNCDSACGCTADPFSYSCVVGSCGAECDTNDDCADTDCGDDRCIGRDYYDYTDMPNTCLGSCLCTDNQCAAPVISYNDSRCTPCQTDSDCDVLDRDYCHGPYILHDEGRCVDFECRVETSHFENCDDGIYCNGQESCSDATCVAGTTVACTDSLFCTVEERCDETLDRCVYDQKDCSANDLPSISECGHVPDSNPFTLDYASGFTSTCDESRDRCTNSTYKFTHICDKEECDAECEPGEIDIASCGLTDVGECEYGLKARTCESGCIWDEWSQCTGAIYPTEEICDGKDNDCNGIIDDSVLYTTCDSNSDCGEPSCGFGMTITPTCVNPGTCNARCIFTIGFVSEICDDGQDNDCDGHIDEGCEECLTDSMWGPGHQFICNENNTYMECVNESYVYRNVCKQYCSASPQCDGRAPNTFLNTCTDFGEVFLQDYCDDNCHLADDNCESSYMGCTADPECDELAPLTGDCDEQCRVERYCGDGIINPPESCELPGTSDSQFCGQTVTNCDGNKLGTRDAFGDCDEFCGCASDPFNYQCVKGQCGAECDATHSCSDSTCSETYDDYCDESLLVDYNNNGIKDSLLVEDSCSNSCLDGCLCTDCTTDCEPPQPAERCLLDICGAECDSNDDCADTDCGDDGCIGNDWYDYTDVANTCLASCGCTDNQCSAPAISYNDPRCTDCQTDRDCNDLDKDYCDGTLIKHDEGKCVNYVCTVETNSVEECNDGKYCNGQESCSDASCHSGTAIDCSDSLFCTINERCDEETDSCKADPMDCSNFNIYSIGTCDNNPDSIHFTWDFRASFTSICNETLDICTGGNETITHTCDVDTCNAECDSTHGCTDSRCSETYDDYCDGAVLVEYDSDKILDSTTVINTAANTCDLGSCFCSENPVDCSAPPTSTYCVEDVCGAECDSNDDCAPTLCGEDMCIGKDWYDYTDVANTCLASCGCTDNQCSAPAISYNDPRCTECQTDDDCDHLDSDYCDGTLIKHEEGICVNFECTTETDTLLNCDDNLYCNGQESCSDASCHSGTAIDCSDSLFCTINERCDEETDSCKADPMDCTGYNLVEIATCDNNPDNIHFTWDYAAGFTSMCSEDLDECTSSNYSYTHTCDTANCGAECDATHGCADSTCQHRYDDYCTGHFLTDYNYNMKLDSLTITNSTANSCEEECECTENSVGCNPPSPLTYCVTGVCGAECEPGDTSSRQCGQTDVGECEYGHQERACTSECGWGSWGTCIGAVYPTEEACDGKDNDCDGIVDNGCFDCIIDEKPPYYYDNDTGWHMVPRLYLDASTRMVTASNLNGGGALFRPWDYAFEGEQISWEVLVWDLNGVEKMGDTFVSVMPAEGTLDACIESNCQYITRTGLPGGSIQYGEETIREFDPDTMRWLKCTFTVESPSSMHGEYLIQIQTTDIDGLRGGTDEWESWFLNPALSLSIEEGPGFGVIRPGTSGYNTMTVQNTAEGGVVYNMFITGTDFYDPANSGAKCPTSNVLRLENFRYYTSNGAYSTMDDQQINSGGAVIRNKDSEGYINIEYGKSYSSLLINNAELIQSPIMIGPYYAGNLLSNHASMSVTFKLSLPEPCVGDFTSGQIYFWAEPV